MKMLYCICLMCAISLTTTAAMSTGQQVNFVGKGTFQIDFDMAKFYANDTAVYVEFYYGIREHILTYKPDSTGFMGGVIMRMILWRDSVIVDQKAWTVPHHVTDTASLAIGKTMVGLESAALKPGTYRLAFVTTDINNTARKDSLFAPLVVKSYPADQEAFSDIELCTTIAPAADTTGMFYKNTLDVIPNASMLYGPGLPFLYYYTEAYNLTNPSHPGDAILRTTIIDGAGKEVYRQSKPKKRMHPSVVEQGKVNISSYRGGTYTLRLTLTDTLEHIYASTTKKFFVYRPGMIDSLAMNAPVPAADFATSEFATMSDSMVDREFAVARYIASEPERKQYGKLHDLDAKRKFMFDFWKNRNTTPSSGRNDVKAEYMRRVAFADQTYSRGFQEGWKSDRGRVYILYGAPDEIEQFPSTSESNPYEIWHYNSLQGGVIFVFVDRMGMGRYQLVHSTHRDELHDENWYQQYAQKTQ